MVSKNFNKVISLCTPYLDSIHDLHVLLETSKSTNQSLLTSLTPHTLLSILHRTSWLDRLTTQHLLLSYIASGFPSFLLHPPNRNLFKLACLSSPESLLHLALSRPSIPASARPKFTLGNVGSSWVKRKEVLEGVGDLVDRCVGEQWYDIPDFWDGGREDAATLFAEPRATVFHLATYGEMWGGEVEKAYQCLLDRQDEDKARTEGKVNGRDGDVDGEDGGVKCGRRSNGQNREKEEKYYIPPEMMGSEVSLRCEWVKYTLVDWHTTIPLRKRDRPCGITSSYPCSPVIHPSTDATFPPKAKGTNDASLLLDRINLGPPLTMEDWIESVMLDDMSDSPSTISFISADSDPGRFSSSTQEGTQEDTPTLPQSDIESSTTSGSATAGPDRFTHEPNLHPIRQVYTTDGPYKDDDVVRGQEHVTVMLHLLQTSPLWRRITSQIRHRVIEAQSEENGPGVKTDPSVLADMAEPVLTTSEEEEEDVRTYTNNIKWRRVLWEDALWTSGWEGLELIAIAWESDSENTKAIARRAERSRSTSTSISTSPSISMTRSIFTSTSALTGPAQRAGQGVPDDHPALRRLKRIYQQIQRLDREPTRVTLKSITRSERKKAVGYVDVPIFLGDLWLIAYDDHLGPVWEVE